MKKNIWIFNHYATNMYQDQAGRHFWFSESLMRKGYNPVIFCASTIHNSSDFIDTEGENYSSDIVKSIPFVFVKTPSYIGNGFKRIKNMFAFYRNLFSVAKAYKKKNGAPDVILASSVHPLALVAGIKIAKKMGIPCICEVRDLWPESLVAYGALNRESLIAKTLYKGEKWIYKNADSIIMTWEGGAQYILDQGWDEQVNINKVHHISNGVIIDAFDKNSEKHIITDSDLDDKNFINIVYAGSIRKVNNLGLLLDAAKIIQEEGKKNIRFLIYGDGNESEILKERCKQENIQNVIFKGRVEKKYIPSILKKSDINILHNSSTSLDKYGQSQNKFFEYLAAGKCIVQTYSTNYSVIDRYNCGISVPIQDEKEIAKAIIKVSEDEKSLRIQGENARRIAYDYDFTNLTDRLIRIIENID